jgi:hypothetical protein
MSLFKQSDVFARADRATGYTKSAPLVFAEQAQVDSSVTQFDIFLSHSYIDQKLILGIYLSLRDLGYTVYVDWIHDRQLSRESVNKETARTLRNRMQQSRALFYVTTGNSSSSKWMPWELGFKDGHNGKAAILPIVDYETENFSGQEYLGIYPYISQGDDSNGKKRLWVRTSSSAYVWFEYWLQGQEPYQR